MRGSIKSRLTYANVMATGAMFIALGGGAYALSGVPDSNGVFHGCVDNRTGLVRVVKSASSCHRPRGHGKHRDAGELAVSWNQQGRPGLPGQTGATGPNGALGPNGAPGSALAYAHVLADGGVDPVNSKNVSSSNVSETSAHSGSYCFRGLPFTPHSAVATAGFSANGDGVLVELAGTPDFGLTGCSAGTQLVVITFLHPAKPGNQDADFYIQIN
jgi:hypothetical protein